MFPQITNGRLYPLDHLLLRRGAGREEVGRSLFDEWKCTLYFVYYLDVGYGNWRLLPKREPGADVCS